jgi:hypothetical protein
MHPEVKSKRAHPDPGLLTIFKNMRQIPGSGIYSTTLVNLLNVLKLVLFCFYIIIKLSVIVKPPNLLFQIPTLSSNAQPLGRALEAPWWPGGGGGGGGTLGFD